MTRSLLTVAAILLLSGSLAYGGQARQRWPSSSGGGQSTGGQASGGQSSGGQSSGGQSAGGQSSGGHSSGGGGAVQRSAPRESAPPPPPPSASSGRSQIQRWGAPREQREEAAPAPAPAPTQNAGGTTQIQRWGMPREREGASASPRLSAPSSGFARGVPRTPPADSPGPSVTPVEPAQASQGFARGVPRASATTAPSATAVEPQRAAAADSGQRFAQPRRVPRPEELPQNANVAVPRGSVLSNPRPGDDAAVYVPRTGRIYSNYYYYPPYPRHIYPHGYGGFGLGYFYYDPYTWYDTYYPTYPAYGSYYGSSYYGGSYAAAPYTYNYGYPTGEIRLQVHPRNAEVYVDGYYAGRVDDFDGFLQGLRLEEGPHTIEIVAAGYETLVFNVRIVAGRKIDYRAELQRY